jgi:hypothetical protein
VPKIDFSQAKELKAVPAGTYEAVLTEQKIFTAKSSNQEAIALTFTIQDENFPEHEGRKQWRNYSLQPQALWALKKSLVDLGCDPEELEGTVDLEEVIGQLIGNKCLIEVGVRMYEGEERNEVRKVRPLSDWQ